MHILFVAVLCQESPYQDRSLIQVKRVIWTDLASKMEELLGASFVNIVAMVALAIAMVTILSMCVCKTGESQ